VVSDGKSITCSTFSVVELASAETNKAGGDKSLLNLSQVIMALGNQLFMKPNFSANNSKTVPYQDSQLTNLLQHSLGGESKTIMVVHISPLLIDAHNTLRFVVPFLWSHPQCFTVCLQDKCM
jgi:hypothetical protein